MKYNKILTKNIILVTIHISIEYKLNIGLACKITLHICKKFIYIHLFENLNYMPIPNKIYKLYIDPRLSRHKFLRPNLLHFKIHIKKAQI